MRAQFLKTFVLLLIVVGLAIAAANFMPSRLEGAARYGTERTYLWFWWCDGPASNCVVVTP